MTITNAFWFTLVGGLLMLLGLSRPIIRTIPATSAMIYLAAGIILGPTGLALYHFNPLKEAKLLEILTEVAVLISLFAAGVKMPVPFNLKRWRAPLQLAFISMTITVICVAAFGHYILALPLGAAVLLGAIVAPTDPVLATDVQVRHPGDEDKLRFSLTCEAGLNDGSAFPFVMLGLGLLGLHDLGGHGSRWLAIDLVWATGAGIVIGICSGAGVAKMAYHIRHKKLYGGDLLDDFLGLGLIALVYGISLYIHAWGFLAVFAAAVALRQTELRQSGAAAENENLQDETLGPKGEDPPNTSAVRTSVSEASLVFKEHLERLSEIVLILLVGGSLFLDSWSLRAIGFTIFLFFLVRPFSVFIGLIGSDTTLRVRLLAGWFGVRGIGSLYYLMYAIVHGLPETLSLELLHITLVVVTMSIFIHGTTVKPLLKRFAPVE